MQINATQPDGQMGAARFVLCDMPLVRGNQALSEFRLDRKEFGAAAVTTGPLGAVLGGVADLRHLHDPERVDAMLGVAHPSWRTQLAKEARALPSMQGVDAVEAQLIALQDGRHALLRPATREDITAIGDYIGRDVRCKILKIDEARRNIVVSRRKQEQ